MSSSLCFLARVNTRYRIIHGHLGKGSNRLLEPLTCSIGWVLPGHTRAFGLQTDLMEAKQKVPFPYLGDLRLFMQDEDGVYCLNWPVKRKFGDFRGKGPKSKPRPINDPDDPASLARQELECAYHADAEIRTQPVALDQFDTEVRLNLRNMFLDECRPIALSDQKRQEALSVAFDHIGKDVAMHVVARRMALAVAFAETDAMALIHQAIWRRELRVDLFRPVLTSKPLRPEIRDILDVYGSWFAR
jgi:hypothetical protein